MDVVIDTSAVLAVVLGEPQKAALIHATRGAVLRAPASVHWEVGNALTASFKRGRVTLDEARSALAAYERIAIRFVEVALNPVVALCHRMDLYAYDGYVLQCAIDQGNPLLTLDRGLQQAASKAGISIMEVRS